jgi:GDP/UDP-N,N'-diacetylbacillosamine 2-epimerase (hydrolysing)
MLQGQPRAIHLISSSRADYGLLSILLDELRSHPNLFQAEMVLVGDATHLVNPVDRRTNHIHVARTGDSESAVARFMGATLQKVAEYYEKRAHPDLAVILGDRTEMLAVAAALLPLRIPVAHLHGGEMSLGAIDDSARHAITKLSHFHFASTETYRNRILQLGEPESTVWNVGAIGLGAFSKIQPSPKIDRGMPTVLCTLHPVTLNPKESEAALDALIEFFEKEPGYFVMISASNLDAGGERINARFRAWVDQNPNRAEFSEGLGLQSYWDWMRSSRFMIGNSSSGIIEAHSAGLPCINVGSRQDGRVKPPSVIDCSPTLRDLEAAVRKAESTEFRQRTLQQPNPYGDGKAAQRIVQTLAGLDFRGGILKTFRDRKLTL